MRHDNQLFEVAYPTLSFHNILAQLRRNQFSCESGEIEKTLAMTLIMHFDSTQHVVIASVCSDDFSRPGSLRAERSNLSLINKLHLIFDRFCHLSIFFLI
ncbi:MAG: hypothetical protein U0586_15080 [Candidatus Brocadiaceae bacterium]